MKTSQALTKATLLAAALLLSIQPGPAAAGAASAEIAWSELSYRASKLGFTLKAEVAIEPLTQAEIDWALFDPEPGGWLSSPADGGWLLRLVTEGLGGKSTLELLLDNQGSSLQRIQYLTGRRLKDRHHRTTRFSDSAIHITTVKPNADEMELEHHEWTKSSVWIKSLPAEVPHGTLVGQPSGLFYTLATAKLAQPGDRHTAYVFSKSQVMRVELVAHRWASVEVDHAVESASGTHRRKGVSTVMEISIIGATVEAGGDSTDFRFLGLRDNVRVYVDPQTRVPVLITGSVGLLGNARVELERVRLR